MFGERQTSFSNIVAHKLKCMYHTEIVLLEARGVYFPFYRNFGFGGKIGFGEFQKKKLGKIAYFWVKNMIFVSNLSFEEKV